MKIKSRNDKLIDKFIKDPNYKITIEGFIYTATGRKIGYDKKGELKKRGKAYKYVKYLGKELKVHRIIYRQFNGILDTDLVVHHKDSNSFNNCANNLELVTQEINIADIFSKKSA